MPGEDPGDALAEAAKLESSGFSTVVTYLGENVHSHEEAEQVHRHYETVVDQIHAGGLGTHPSVKLTHMGLDLGADIAREGVSRVAGVAARHGSFVWIDMEYSRYVDQTLDVLDAVRKEHENVGICLQAYLHRTPSDLERLTAEGVPIRLVKGAYQEPPEVAIPRKADVDDAFHDLAVAMVQGYSGGQVHGIATHDLELVRRIQRTLGADQSGEHPYEVQMLYGIQRGAQRTLAEEGVPVRILISYGDAWFPWYMRRLAERPANVGFVLRSMLSS